MADVLVTGSEGFLGRHLVARLVSHKFDVCGTYGYTPPEDMHRTKYLSHFQVDVTNFNECLKIVNQEQPKIVYHLVAQPIVTSAIIHPFTTMEQTIRGSYNMLEAIRQSGRDVKAVVYMSSDKVYGCNTHATENDPLLGIDHPYNVSKVAGDIIAQMYASSYGLPVVIARSANIYGGGDFHWERLIPGISRDILMGRSPVIRSNGKQVRDYIYSEDAATGLMYMAWAMLNNRTTKGSIFNFGSVDAYTSSQIVDKLLLISGRIDLIPNILNKAKDEIEAQHIDFDKARRVLGWEPMVSMDEGLEKTYSWYREWFAK